jgi:hypothetical protein
MNKSKWLEVLLAEVVIYFLLWLYDDYLATILSVIFGTICLLILIVSIMVEIIEPSKVPRWYFTAMIASILAPAIALGIYFAVGGELSWLRG